MAGARPPDAAAARRFCALPRDLQGSAGRTREGPCGGCGRAAGSAGANAHGPPPMAAFAAARAHGRAFASFLCTIAAGVRGGGTGRRFFTPHPMRAISECTIAAGVRRAAGRAGASPPHIPWPRVRVVSVHDRRRRAAAEGRAGASPPHIPRPRVRSVPVHGRRGVRSSGRAFTALKFIPCAGRICAYSRCAAAASASAQSVRSQGRSRSARRRSGRRPRSAGRWGGAGRASR